MKSSSYFFFGITMLVIAISIPSHADDPTAVLGGRGGGTVLSMTGEFRREAQRIYGTNTPTLPIMPRRPLTPQEQLKAIQAEMQKGRVVIAGLGQHWQFLRQQMAGAQQLGDPVLISMVQASMQETGIEIERCQLEMTRLHRMALAIQNGQ